jgi:hypothetical protein
MVVPQLARSMMIVVALTAAAEAAVEPTAFRFRGTFDAVVDCSRPFRMRHIPIHGYATGVLKSDKTASADLHMRTLFIPTRIHFGGQLGEPTPAPGGTARAEITGENHLRLVWDLPNNLIINDIDISEKSCTANLATELKPGKTIYTLNNGMMMFYCDKPRVTHTSCRIR